MQNEKTRVNNDLERWHTGGRGMEIIVRSHVDNTAACQMQAMKILRMAPYGMLRHVALVRTDVSEELSASIIRVIRIGELGT
jgi:hypothetical protein